MKIIIKNPRKYLREKDWEFEREEIETEIENILGLKTKNNPNYYVVENFLNAFEKERLKIKEENSLKNQFKNLFKNIFKKAE